MFYPPDSHHVDLKNGERTSGRTNGCWRIRDETSDGAYLSRVSTAFTETVEASATYGVEHHVYYHAPDDSCYPHRDYHGEVAVTARTANTSVRSTHQFAVSVAADGTMSIE